MTYIVAYIASLVTFLVVDALWLGYVAKPMYQAEIGGMLRDSFKVAPAAVFYLFYVAGVVYFAIYPNLVSANFGKVLFSAFIFGLLAYGTYDMTNYATLKNWPLKLSVIDMIWGGVVTSISATAGYFATKLVG